MNQGPLSTKAPANRGVTLVEVIFGASIISMVVAVLLFSLNIMIQHKERLLQQSIALYKAEEGVELVRFLRDDDWTNISTLSTDTTYYLSVSTTTITTTGTPEVEGDYLREFVLRDVYRDLTSDDIVASTTGSSYVDTDARWIEVSVGYQDGTTTLATLVTNLF